MEQKCFFGSWNWYINGEDGPLEICYVCEIKEATHLKKGDIVITNTSNNVKTNAAVEVVLYRNSLNFIPNSIFTTFVNLEQLWVGKHFIDMEPDYLRNASKLKIFGVEDNDLTVLKANLFVGAPNLQYINFRNNKITSIHKLTFSGLSLLKNIYLQGNQIKNLHSDTFFDLLNLQVLNLLNNKCIDKNFVRSPTMFEEIEENIDNSCSYLISEDLAEIEMEKKIITRKLTVKLEELKKSSKKDYDEHQSLLSKYNQLMDDNLLIYELNLNLTRTVEELEFRNVLDQESLSMCHIELKSLNETEEIKEQDINSKFDELKIENGKLKENFENQLKEAKETLNSITASIRQELSDEMQKIKDDCATGILKTENISLNNHMVLLKMFQEQKNH